MGIIKTIETKHGIDITDAYLKIEKVNMNIAKQEIGEVSGLPVVEERMSCNVYLQIYNSKEDRDTRKPFIDKMSLKLDTPPKTLEEAYNMIKLIDGWTEVVDEI